MTNAIADWDDMATRRSSIYDQVLTTFSKQWPQSYGGVRLEVSDLRYDGPEQLSLAKQKKALLNNQFPARRILGTVRLVDERTQSVLDERSDQSLMRVPILTDRGTFIHNGTEYSVLNQARLLPGVYTRRKASGELESHFNVKRGTGNSFRIVLEPDTGLFKLNVGQSSLRLYSLLHDLDVPDDQLEKVWGSDLLRRNREAYDRRVFDKAHARLVRRADPMTPRPVKQQQLLQALQGAQLHRGVLARTLPARVNGPLLTTKEALALIPETAEETFSKEDFQQLALLLNRTLNAGLPLDLPLDELVQRLRVYLDRQQPQFNASLFNYIQQKQSAENFGCLMARLSPVDAVKIVRWSQEHIPEADLALDGYEHEPHVTVRFGCKPSLDADRLATWLKTQMTVTVTLKEVDCFSGVCDGLADCLVVKVDSPDLQRLRKAVDQEFAEDLEKPTHDQYRPHLTLAYVKPGCGQALRGHCGLEGTYTFSELVYSTPGRREKRQMDLKCDEMDVAVPAVGDDESAGRVEGELGGGGLDG